MAMPPATCGAAMEVPELFIYPEPLPFTEYIDEPGARISGLIFRSEVVPRLEKPDTGVPEPFVDDATERDSGHVEGEPTTP